VDQTLQGTSFQNYQAKENRTHYDFKAYHTLVFFLNLFCQNKKSLIVPEFHTDVGAGSCGTKWETSTPL
jgi:hypothetical protein